MADTFDPYQEWLGIPPKEQPPNHYRLLGLEPFENLPSVIRAAVAERTEHLRTYQLSKQHLAKCQELLNDIAAASVCLLNVKKKAAYDIRLRDEMAARGALPKRMARPGPPPLPKTASPGGSSTDSSRLPGWVMKLAFPVGGLAVLGLIFLVSLFFQGNGPSEVASADDPPPSRRDSEEEPAGKAEESQPDTEKPRIQETQPDAEESNAPPDSAAETASGKADESSDGPPEAGAAKEPETALDRAIARARSSMVRVSPVGGSREAQPGVGFVLGSERLIVTSYRTIDGATGAIAFLDDGTRVDLAAYVAVDKQKDLALLPMGRQSYAPALFLASKLPGPGEDVAALNPPGVRSGLNCTGEARGEHRGGQAGGRRSRFGSGFGSGFGSVGPTLPSNLDGEATWIQTTARISKVNSGGPLINSQGEVVGVNVWTGSGAPGVYFALAAEEVQRLLASASGDPRPLASLGETGGAETAAVPRTEERITLSSGKVFHRGVLRDNRPAAESLARSWSSDDDSVVRAQHGSLFSAAYVSHHDGVLNGLAAAFHDDDTLKICATYRNNKLDGPLKLWDTEGQDLYWCDYTNGDREGVCCLFKEDELWMVSECSKDKVVHIILVSEGKQIARFDDRQLALADQLAGAALRACETVEKDVGKCDLQFKLSVRSEKNKKDKAERRKLASELGPIKRNNIKNRMNQRQSDRDSQMKGLRRQSGVTPR